MSEEEGSRAAEPQSVEDWFVAYETPLLRYAQRLLGHPEASQEIVQETFMRLHEQIDQVNQPRAWLFRTVHNLALNARRKHKKIVPLDTEAPASDADPSVLPRNLGPDEYLQRAETIRLTQECLKTLKERHRELIRLKFEEGLSYKAISKRTGLSTSNVGYLLHHALKHLATSLAQKGVQL